jgi:hypothetical protein
MTLVDAVLLLCVPGTIALAIIIDTAAIAVWLRRWER